MSSKPIGPHDNKSQSQANQKANQQDVPMADEEVPNDHELDNANEDDLID